MILHHFVKTTIIRNLTVMCLVIGLSAVGPAYAGPRNHRHKTAYPAAGKIIRAIPSGHALVHVGPNRYYYNAGIFYRKGPKGYAVVRAPFGAVVMHLPVGYRTMMVAGVTYFFFAGVYYRKTSSGYQVVKAPAEETDSSQTLQQVLVTAKLLNVRSGPGLHHPIVDKVHNGNVLVVQGNAPEWYFVNLPNGNFGWVMSKYTRNMNIPAQAEG